MQIGLFNLVQKRGDRLSTDNILRGLLDDVKLAEDIGMDICWTTEHHFSNYSLCVSPLLAIAWLAGQTKRIRLAPGVLVLPLYQPLRLIQEFESLRMMTGGRVDFGIGTGYQDFEFKRFGLSLADSTDRALEIMEMFHQSMETGVIKFQGRYYDVPETPIGVHGDAPPPTVFAASGLNHPVFPRTVVRRGYVPMLASNWHSIEPVLKQRAAYDQIACEEGVDPLTVPLTVMRFVHVTDSRDDAREAAEAFRASIRVAVGLRFNYAEFDGPRPRDIPAANEPTIDEIIDNAVIGDAQTCIEKIVSESRLLRATHYACMMNTGGLSPQKVHASMERMGRDVIPAVHNELGLSRVA